MTVLLPPPTHPELAAARERLDQDGYVVVRGAIFGLPADFDQSVHRMIFPDTEFDAKYNPQADRDRARDVLRYDRVGGGIFLRPHDDITIYQRNDDRPRLYKRIPAATYAPLLTWVGGCLALVPDNEQDARGTFGINYFRTLTRVVVNRHQDAEAFVCLHVVALNGKGAVTRLFKGETDIEPVYATELLPGDLLMFRDRDFWHDATPIEPIDDKPFRDALVCTVNAANTYPLESA